MANIFDEIERQAPQGGNVFDEIESGRAPGPYDWQTDEQRAEAEMMRQSPDRGGIVNFVTGNDRVMSTIPRISEDDVFGLTLDNAQAVAGTSLTYDPEARKNIYTKQLNDAGIEHEWVQDQFGNNVLIYTDRETGEKKQGYLDPQGFNWSDLSTTLGAAGVGKAVQGLGRGAMKLMGREAGKASLKGAAAAGAAAGGAESVLMDAGANAVGADLSAEDIVQNAALSGIAGGVFDAALGPARAGAINRSRGTSPTAMAQDAADAKATLSALRETGMDESILTPQLSNDPYQLMVQRTLLSLPGSSRKIAQRLEQQDRQAYDALLQFMSDIAPSQALDSADTNAKRFAESYLKGLRGQASQAARPFYEAAYSVNLDPAVRQSLVDDEVIGAALRRVTRKPAYAREIKQYGEDSLMPFDLVKRELDDQIQSLQKAGRNNEARSIKAARDGMVDKLREVSPDYQKALETYAQAIGPHAAAEAGTVGKMARVSPEKVDKVVKYAFDSPDSAKIARKMIYQMDPSGETWNGLVARYMSDRLSDMRGLLFDETGDMVSSKGNVPRNLYDKIWPNQQAKEVMNSALTSEQRRRLEKIMVAMNAFARGRGAGSETAMRQPLIDDLGRGKMNAAFDLITSPIKYFDDKFVENRVMRRSSALADLIMRTDSKALNAEMKKLMEVDATTPAFMRGLEAVLGRYASADDVNQEQDQ